MRRHLAAAANSLALRREKGLPPLELGFFGGSFTALPAQDLRACLDFAAFWREQGGVLSFRCSTRPDRLDPPVLEALKSAGCTLVELGIQSFSDTALRLSRRGYTGAEARRGCELVARSGLKLGIQLMPGMPGLEAEEALDDVETGVAFSPDCARLYPCLVFEGAPLAALWRSNGYQPLDLTCCVDLLARASLRFLEADVAVIRMGVAEDERLAGHVLAGPRHPALGNMARARALYLFLREQLAACPFPSPRLFVPQRFQGEFWGHAKALVPLYAALGLTRENVVWWKDERFVLAPAEARATWRTALRRGTNNA